MWQALKDIGNTIVIAIKNVFWWIGNTILDIGILILDIVANLLPDYTLEPPSVFFSDSRILPHLNWIFPVDFFIACLTFLAGVALVAFTIGPLLRIVKVIR